MKHTFAFSHLVFAIAFSGSVANAADVTWLADEAVAIGSGCNTSLDRDQPVDTFFIANGGDLSVVWSGLQIYLDGYDGKLADRQNCSIRIPVQTAPEFYIGEIEQQLSHYVLKSRGARLSIASRATVANVPISPFSVSYPTYEHVQTIYENSRVDSLEYNVNYIKSWCANPTGIYKFDVAMGAQRNSHHDTVIAGGIDRDIHLDLSRSLSQCPTL